MTLRTRKPTGAVAWPLTLLEGEEKAGKSWMAATLSASNKVGRTFWIQLGEGTADEYGAIPGVRYEVVEHDGTWRDLFGAVRDIREIAKQAVAKREKPTVLVIDSMPFVWDLLKDWISNRARSTEKAKKILRADPEAEIAVTANLWNDANARHRSLMKLLITFPGIVVMISRGKWVTAMTNGQPDPNKPKDYRVEGQKELAFDAGHWIRLQRGEHPLIVGAQSVHAGIVPGEDKPVRRPELTLEQFIFDIIKLDPATAEVRKLIDPQAGSEPPDDMPMADEQRDRVLDLIKASGLDRDAGMALVNEAIAPEQVGTWQELTYNQATTVIERFTKFVAQLTPPAEPEGAQA
ncbi:MAG TPA: hypothetical protein DGT23_04035 [Micromonosporaceae bacterium]|nr:hypothetical protein [Micromonosporaceae bacterium]